MSPILSFRVRLDLGKLSYILHEFCLNLCTVYLHDIRKRKLKRLIRFDLPLRVKVR